MHYLATTMIRKGYQHKFKDIKIKINIQLYTNPRSSNEQKQKY